MLIRGRRRCPRLPSGYALSVGDAKPEKSVGELIAQVYPTLRRMAAAKARGSPVAPSSLVQDTLVRLLHQRDLPREASMFEACAWRLMEWCLVDRIRSNKARREREQAVGGDAGELGEDPAAAEHFDALHQYMEELVHLDPRKAEAVILVLSCGLSHERAAEMLGVSAKTVQRDVQFARAWLAQRIRLPDESRA
jgi:RNA polymerase sigma factor (sigma-70 family)